MARPQQKQPQRTPAAQSPVPEQLPLQPHIFRVTKGGAYPSKGGAMATLAVGQVIDAFVYGWDAVDRMKKVGIELTPVQS